MKSICLLVVCLALAPFASAQGYKVIDLGTLMPVGIDLEGEVAGNVNGHAAIWTNAHGLRDLGLLPGGTFSTAAAINDLGVVAGTADGPGYLTGVFLTPRSSTIGTVDCDHLARPFTWSSRDGMKSPTSIPGAWLFDNCFSAAEYSTGINNFDEVVGSNLDSGTYKYLFTWMKGATSTDLIHSGYQSRANGVNDSAEIAGQWTLVNTLDNASHAVLWQNGVAKDLGSLAGGSSDNKACSGANSVNDLGEVAGWSTTTDSNGCVGILSAVVHAIVWTPKTGMQDIGTLPGDTYSLATKVNLFGVVIGSSGKKLVRSEDLVNEYEYEVEGHPFVWIPGRGMRDLNSLLNHGHESEWVLKTATDINAWGQIVGTGTYRGETHGYLLTPRILFRY